DNNGKIVINPPRVRKIAIDDYPLPVFESKLQRYGFEDRSKSEFFTWSVLSARGCPFQCVYCATEHQVRFRSIENVMQEIRLMKNRYGITHFCFEDDTFSLRADRLKQLCAALAAENVKWSCVTRVDTLTEELVQIMQKSGCTQVFLGIETGSAKTLERIRKKISLEQVETALNLFKRYNIPAMGFFIIGFHWETFADMKATVDLIKRLPLDSFQINIATPLPGTALFHELTESGRLNPEKIDWSQLHQGSYNMNFSDFPQQHWEKMLEHLQKRAFSLLKKKVIRLNLRRLLSDPKFIVKKLWNRFKANPRLLNWFVESKKAVTESQGSAHE
ncbi:MAG: radical SAM protein, partial [Candidatus Riflebacteria bacterium]